MQSRYSTLIEYHWHDPPVEDLPHLFLLLFQLLRGQLVGLGIETSTNVAYLAQLRTFGGGEGPRLRFLDVRHGRSQDNRHGGTDAAVQY